ncbi:MAG TPA: RNA polymerase sigma factor [Solirubrobacteraceae bacterium]|jgi:RNA polymerase sigma factor (sigma-70 family)|nr:RNA polymerase sigma factor [Solirubrobacteraceae bacterium]
MLAAPLTSLSDDDLVARFRAGNDAAFTEIHARFRAPLIAFARRMLRGSGHDAEDVVQDAMIRAYRGLRVTDRPMVLRPWLYMIVRNRALDALRTPQRADCFDDEIGLCGVPDSDPADRVAERDEMRRLVAEIVRLPERQRMALVLREFDGRSHAETARALHTTVPATKSLIIRARSNLGAALVAA